MPVIVVATHVPKPERAAAILAALERVIPRIHGEDGCELYAVHADDERIIIVERWSGQDALDLHAAGEPVAELTAQIHDWLAEPADVQVLQNLPYGTPTKGTIQ